MVPYVEGAPECIGHRPRRARRHPFGETHDAALAHIDGPAGQAALVGAPAPPEQWEDWTRGAQAILLGAASPEPTDAVTRGGHLCGPPTGEDGIGANPPGTTTRPAGGLGIAWTGRAPRRVCHTWARVESVRGGALTRSRRRARPGLRLLLHLLRFAARRVGDTALGGAGGWKRAAAAGGASHGVRGVCPWGTQSHP